MNKYGIVNAYYDLNWGFDKPHFQAVEMQKPVVPNEGYNKALRWKNAIKALRNIYQAKINRACLISQKAQLLWYEKVKRFEELLKN